MVIKGINKQNSKIKFLIGDTRTKAHIVMLEKLGWGRMLNVKLVTPYKNEFLGFDNHAYADFINGLPFNEKKFLYRIEQAKHLTENFIVAVAPDRLGEGDRSLDMSNSWIGKLSKENGFPWFLAVQDGMTFGLVEDSITKYNYKGIFLGGGDEFKMNEGFRYAELSRKYGLKFHYGRCGTKRKLCHAYSIGATSADSVIPPFDKNRVMGVVRTLNFLNGV